jgi:hypothetical protein
MVDLGVIIHHAMLLRELSPIRCETLEVDPVQDSGASKRRRSPL